MGEITLDLRLVFRVPEKRLTINGLIVGLKDGIPQIHGAILTALMKAIEERVVERWVQKDPERYRRNGSQSKARELKSSLGPIRYRLAQMVDRKTAKSFTPLVSALSIPAHDHYLEEAMEPSIGLVAHISFRRATSEVERIQNRSMSHTTVHRRLREFAQTHNPFGEMKSIPFQFLLVDGTKVRLQGAKAKDLGLTEMRWALASRGPIHRFEPVGFWIQTSWKEIGQDLNRRLNYRKLKVLFSDGGPGIEESLLGPGMRPQRCLWHGKRDFPYLLYADGIKKGKQAPFVEKLKSIPALQLTKHQLESLHPEDRPRIEQIVRKTKQGFKELVEALDSQKYPQARVYIQNLMKPVTTFLSWWLEKGEVIPLNTNAIESAFSQVCNRIKRVGRRWSDLGLLNWLKMVFYKVFKPDLWGLQWLGNRKRLPKTKLISLQISFSWSNTIT